MQKGQKETSENKNCGVTWQEQRKIYILSGLLQRNKNRRETEFFNSFFSPFIFCLHASMHVYIQIKKCLLADKKGLHFLKHSFLAHGIITIESYHMKKKENPQYVPAALSSIGGDEEEEKRAIIISNKKGYIK